MGDIKITKINRFDGGMAFDKRSKSLNKFAVTKHFEVLKYPHKLVPEYQKMVAGSAGTEAQRLSAVQAFNLLKLTYAKDGANTNKLFGLSSGASSRPVVASYDVDNAAFLTDEWQTEDSADDANARYQDVFFYYNDYLYMWAANGLNRWKTDNSDGWTDDYFTGMGEAILSLVQPVHHTKDDVAYFFYNNYICKQDGASAFEDKVFTFPSDSRITAACEYGNYLAIATVNNIRNSDKNAASRATVYLWDRDTSLTELSEKIDFGTGEIVHLETLNGVLTAVVNGYAVIPLSMARGSVFIRQLSGNTAVTVNEIEVDVEATQITSAATGAILTFPYEYYLPKVSHKKDEKLYFPMRADLDGDPRNGIWVLNSRGELALGIVEPELDDVDTYLAYKDIYFTGNMIWVIYSSSTNANTSTKVYNTDSTLAFSTSLASVYESLIFDNGDPHRTDKLIGVSVSHEALPADGKVIIKYRTDGDLDDATAWTTIITNTTDGDLITEAINDTTGAILKTHKEVQFRIESYGGAVITGLKFKTESIDEQLI